MFGIARDAEQMAAVFETVPGGKFASVDITSSGACRDAVAQCVGEFGRLDVLVNVAGFHQMRHTPTMTDEDWDRDLAVNLNGPFFLCRAALPHLLESAGNIVNVTSIAGVEGEVYSAGYCAAKHGLIGLTRALAVEYTKEKIRVNAICPGGMPTAQSHGVHRARGRRLGSDPAHRVAARVHGDRRCRQGDRVSGQRRRRRHPRCGVPRRQRQGCGLLYQPVRSVQLARGRRRLGLRPPTSEEEDQADGAEAQRPDHSGRDEQEDVPAGEARRRRLVGRQPQPVVAGQRTLCGASRPGNCWVRCTSNCRSPLGVWFHTPHAGVDAVEQHLALAELARRRRRRRSAERGTARTSTESSSRKRARCHTAAPAAAAAGTAARHPGSSHRRRSCPPRCWSRLERCRPPR